MDLSQQLNRIRENLSHLRARDPYGNALFGATSHQYRLKPVASEAEVVAFEENHQLVLPHDYREFILKVGNGGAGPYYGLLELAAVNHALVQAARAQWISVDDEAHPLCGKVRLVSFSSSFEYSSVSWGALSSEERARKLKKLSADKYSEFTEFALEIGTEGCNISILLVITGPYRGEIWSVWSEEFFGFSYHSHKPLDVELDSYDHQPFEHNGEGAFHFVDWYEYWLNAGLNRVSGN